MNIKFMSEFYERFYDDPVFETIGQKEEYKEIKRRIKEGEEKLRKIIGEIESDTWELFEDIMTAQYEYVTLVAKEMYLIPNLVECVKQYSEYEKGIFAEITELRVSYLKDSTNLKSAEKINNKMNEIVALAENYPELKASEQYLNLQRNLTKLESQLQAARRIYNMEVTNYNNKIETVPSNIIAKLFRFKCADLFQIQEYKRENVIINNEDK